MYIYLKIAGDANEDQILTAARYYHDRPIILTRVSVECKSCRHKYTFSHVSNIKLFINFRF